MAVLRTAGLRKVYGSGALSVVALGGVDLTVEPGELVALLGPSGSGKTTLLLSISLIVQPTAGRIWVNDREVFGDGVSRVDPRRFRRENIGFVFQSHNLIPFLDARDNVAIAAELNGVAKREARRRAAELLDYLEMGARARATVDQLSGGEQQRVAIARALANAPPIIFADEPTASLDSPRGFKVMTMLKRIARERGSAIIVVTHDERMIAGFDTVRRMRDGRFEENGSMAQASSRSARVPEFSDEAGQVLGVDPNKVHDAEVR